MEKISRYFPHIALLSLVLLLWMFVYSNTRLNEAIDRLNAAEQKVDTTLKNLATAQSAIDSVQSDLADFGAYVKDIQGRVEIMDLNKRIEDGQFRSQRSKMMTRLKALYKDVEYTGEDLPEIPIVERP